MNKLISIIIPVYNREYLIIETLESIINQNYQNWECIIIDDRSTDNTINIIKDFIKKDKRFKCFLRPENLPKGGNSCRNYGYEQCKGELVNFFDSDDIMLDFFFTSRMNLIKKETQFIITSHVDVDQELNFICKRDFSISGNLLRSYILWEFPIITNSVLFRKKFLKDKTLFNPSIKRGQETDFFLNVFQNITNEEFEFIDNESFLYRQHSGSISTKANNYNLDYSPSIFRIKSRYFFIGLDMHDKDIYLKAHHQLIRLNFQAIKKNDKEGIKIFLKFYISQNNKLSFYQKLEIKILTYFLYPINFTPKFLEQRWIKFIR